MKNFRNLYEDLQKSIDELEQVEPTNFDEIVKKYQNAQMLLKQCRDFLESKTQNDNISA